MTGAAGGGWGANQCVTLSAVAVLPDLPQVGDGLPVHALSCSPPPWPVGALHTAFLIQRRFRHRPGRTAPQHPAGDIVQVTLPLSGLSVTERVKVRVFKTSTLTEQHVANNKHPA